MPPRRALTRKRQTKLSFSPAPASSSRASLSPDESPIRPTKRLKLDGEVDRGMRLGMPVLQNPHGMFGSSDIEQSSSSESEHMPDTTPPPRRGRRPANRRQQSKSFEVPDDSDARFKEDSEDEEDIPRSAHRRRPVKRASRRDPQEQEDLEDDLEFLQSSPPPDKGRLRSRNTKPLNERQKALEALKARRASSTGEPSSSATPGRKRAIVLSDSESELEIIAEEDDDNVEGDYDETDEEIDADSEPEAQNHPTNALDMFQENVNDADFIDDNANDPIGAPAELTSLPIQFSSLSRAKPRELFKYAVEWMVQKKVNPAFSSDDEIYDLTFRKLDDEVNGLANSKYSSSVWTPDFTRALRARPDIMLDEIGKHMKAITLPHCEACNRKTHPATWNITLTGKPYHKETLEPLESDSSSEPDSDSSSSSSADSEKDLNGEKPTYDSTGERLPPESKIFTLGSTCKANAQMAHTLHHWRYHLNSWVVDYLVSKGHCTPEKLVQRDGWSVKKRAKYANRIVDEMEKEGEIRKLHRLYKEQVDFAFEAKNDYQRGWGRN